MKNEVKPSNLEKLHTEGLILPEGQEFPRCSKCAIAITNEIIDQTKEGELLCQACSPRLKTKKERLYQFMKKLNLDDDGFRKGTDRSKMFAALKRGVSRATLLKIGKTAVGGFLAGVVRPQEVHFIGRSVKFDEKRLANGVYKIESYKKPKKG